MALRSQALAALSGAGAMASILAPAEQLRARLQRYDGALSIAAINGPCHTVVSGEPAALARFIRRTVTATASRSGLWPWITPPTAPKWSRCANSCSRTSPG